MDTYEFFSTILPPEGNGYYCVVELSKHKEHRFVDTIEELIDTATEFDDSGKETYFAVATYKEATNRTALNSAYLRSFFADIDVGEEKEYKDTASALAELQRFCGSTGFDLPELVSSGGGIHAYWPIIEPVPAQTWRQYAEAFKLACEHFGFHIDYSVSADSARVLRVPNTFNRKRLPHRKVSIKSQGIAHPLSHYARLLEPYKKKEVPHPTKDTILDNAPVYATRGPSYVAEISDIQQHNFDNIVAKGDAGCLQIMHYINNAAQDGMEPLWRGVMSIAKYCINGEEKAYGLAALHPYDSDRTAKKFTQIQGPYNCETFAKISPGICEKCLNFGKLTNPIQLGSELKPQETRTVEVQVGTTVQTQTYPTPPDGYILGERGVGIAFSDAEGIPRVAYVADTPFYATITYDRAGERFVQFSYVEHTQVKSSVIPMAVATGRDDSIKAFAKIGILVPTGQDAGFRSYVKSTIAQAKKHPPLLMPTSLGWQHDDTFAYDSRLFTKDGEQIVPMYGFDNINETMGVKGTLDAWRMVIHGVIQMERWDILSMMLIGFASPLMRFTGLNGVTFHLCGNNSGLGKTLCQRLASSVWGVPDKFRVTPNTSPIAMVNRLGMLGNLPLLVDEITHKGRADSEWFPEFLSQMSDGRGKDRMDSQTNAERRNTTTWSSIALMTSNKHMLDYLTAERNHGSEGEIRRLVEIMFDKELKLTELTKSLFVDTLPENYGVAGEAYARWLVRNPLMARTLTKEIYSEVFKNFNATGDERFWIAGCATILAAAKMISKDCADIVDLPIGKIAKFLYDTVKYMRGETKRMKRTAEDILNEFTKRNFGKLVVVNDRMAKIAGIEVAETLDRHDLCGRVEKGAEVGWIDYYIEERELKAFCSSLSYGYAEFKKDIAATCPINYLRKDLLAGTKGPSMQVRCIHVKQAVENAVDIFGDKAANA